MNEQNDRPSDRYPDIEIYIQQVKLPELVDWRTSRLEVSSIEEKGKSTVLMLMNTNDDDIIANGTSMVCTIVPEAVKGNFTSVWITPNNTEWLTDRDFAREAHNHFQLETRCSTGSWDGSDEQGWLRLTPDGESIVNWLAD